MPSLSYQLSLLKDKEGFRSESKKVMEEAYVSFTPTGPPGNLTTQNYFCGKVKNQPPDLTAGEFNRGE